MRHALTILAGLICFVTAAPAAAQFVANDDRGEFYVLTTTTTSAVVAGVIALTVVNVKKSPGSVQRYLDQNETEVRASFALGAGDAAADLADMFGVREDDIVHFATALRRHRGALSHAAFSERDPLRFIELVEQAIAMDPRIRRRA